MGSAATYSYNATSSTKATRCAIGRRRRRGGGVVVGGAASRVAQHFVGAVKRLEALFGELARLGLQVRQPVGVKKLHQDAVGGADFFLGGFGRNAEQVVVTHGLIF